MLCEQNHCIELLCVFPHKASVVGEHEDIALIAQVEEDGTPVAPLVPRYHIPLLESVAVDVVEVIHLQDQGQIRASDVSVHNI